MEALSFSIIRDCGQWSAYECDSGRFATVDDVSEELVRLLFADIASAEAALKMAQAGLKLAKARFRAGPRIRFKP